PAPRLAGVGHRFLRLECALLARPDFLPLSPRSLTHSAGRISIRPASGIETMADAIIDLVGPEELPVISSLYNQIFRPARDVESFKRRFRGRFNTLQLLARL